MKIRLLPMGPKSFHYKLLHFIALNFSKTFSNKNSGHEWMMTRWAIWDTVHVGTDWLSTWNSNGVLFLKTFTGRTKKKRKENEVEERTEEDEKIEGEVIEEQERKEEEKVRFYDKKNNGKELLGAVIFEQEEVFLRNTKDGEF